MPTPEPKLVTVHGRPWWRWDDGKLLPVVSGGDGPDAAAKPDTGKDDANSDSGEKPDTGVKADEKPATGDGQAAEVEKWKALSRKHEEQAKANSAAAKELEKLKRDSMSETEKAVDAAKAEGRAAAMREVGTRLVTAEFKTAAAGRLSPDQLDALVDNLDRARFLNDDGDVDVDKVKAFIDGVAPAQAEDKGKGQRAIRDAQGKRQGKPSPSVQAGRDAFAARHPAKA